MSNLTTMINNTSAAMSGRKSRLRKVSEANRNLDLLDNSQKDRLHNIYKSLGIETDIFSDHVSFALTPADDFSYGVYIDADGNVVA